MYVNLKYILTCICVYKVIILSPKCKFSNITYCQFYAVYLLCVLEIEKLCFNILQETGNRDLSYPIILSPLFLKWHASLWFFSLQFFIAKPREMFNSKSLQDHNIPFLVYVCLLIISLFISHTYWLLPLSRFHDRF